MKRITLSAEQQAEGIRMAADAIIENNARIVRYVAALREISKGGCLYYQERGKPCDPQFPCHGCLADAALNEPRPECTCGPIRRSGFSRHELNCPVAE